MTRLIDKVAVISGAGAGIGKATAKTFAREGAMVVVAEIDKEKGLAVANEIGKAAIFVHTDVTDEESVKNVMNTAVEKFGCLNVLFNCAGGSVANDTITTEVNMDVWDHTIPLDLRGPFLCSRFGIPKMI
jgi:NAD(P)-dependent dehydrogenase (short-subunit alcohol dehydrogenase family)